MEHNKVAYVSNEMECLCERRCLQRWVYSWVPSMPSGILGVRSYAYRTRGLPTCLFVFWTFLFLVVIISLILRYESLREVQDLRIPLAKKETLAGFCRLSWLIFSSDWSNFPVYAYTSLSVGFLLFSFLSLFFTYSSKDKGSLWLLPLRGTKNKYIHVIRNFLGKQNLICLYSRDYT